LRNRRSIVLVVPLVAMLIGANGWSQARPKSRPLPSGVVELIGLSTDGGLVELKDGTLMLAQGGGGTPEQSLAKPHARFSKDGGQTWTQPQELNSDIGVGGMIRLKSGALAIYGKKSASDSSPSALYFSKSMDEGKSWTSPALISDYPNYSPMFHSLIQLHNGRLLLAGYWEGMDGWDYQDGTMVSVHPDLQYLDVSAYGVWRGQKLQIEGHDHGPEMGMSVVYRSDDEGLTWKKHPGALMGWFDTEGRVNGHCGQTSCFEPTITETKDGHVLLLARSTVGRLVQSVSTDGGEHWYAVRPSDLASSASPAMVTFLPTTGDLLIIWNQMSRREIQRGYRRGRLSSAISKDGGHSWQNFKTLELSDGLEDRDHVPPEYPLQMVRAGDWVGPLPDGWAYFHYPNIDVVGDRIIVRYSRGSPLMGVAEQNLHKQEMVMRIYPVKWFYD